MSNPTNADIYRALGALDEKVDQIHEQVKKTNGRVTRLEGKEQRRASVEEYIEKQGVKTPVEIKEGWSIREKTLIGLVSSMVVALCTLIAAGKVQI